MPQRTRDGRRATPRGPRCRATETAATRRNSQAARSGIVARDACVELRAEREQRAVERRRVAPRAAHRRVGDVPRIRARRIAVRIAALHRANATVHPVRPRVGGEERRAGKRQELDGGGDHEHDEDRAQPAGAGRRGPRRSRRTRSRALRRARRPTARERRSESSRAPPPRARLPRRARCPMTHAAAAAACQMRIAGGARTTGGSRTIAPEGVTGGTSAVGMSVLIGRLPLAVGFASVRKRTTPTGLGSLATGAVTALGLAVQTGLAAIVGVVIARKLGRTAETDGFFAAYGVFIVLALAATRRPRHRAATARTGTRGRAAVVGDGVVRARRRRRVGAALGRRWSRRGRSPSC